MNHAQHLHVVPATTKHHDTGLLSRDHYWHQETQHDIPELYHTLLIRGGDAYLPPRSGIPRLGHTSARE